MKQIDFLLLKSTLRNSLPVIGDHLLVCTIKIKINLLSIPSDIASHALRVISENMLHKNTTFGVMPGSRILLTKFQFMILYFNLMLNYEGTEVSSII